jgi:hypothetical protein
VFTRLALAKPREELAKSYPAGSALGKAGYVSLG